MSSITPQRLSGLIHALYAAAENPDLWSDFLEALADEVKSHMTVLVAISRDDEVGSASAAVRVDPEAVRLYNETWGERDVWIDAGRGAFSRAGSLVYTEELISDRDLVKTSFFNDFARPFGMFHALNATFLADPQLSASIACHYPRTARAPTKEAHELLELLMPHMAQAVRFHGKWRALMLAEQATADAVGCASIGFLFLDRRGFILRANAFAEVILRRGDGLRTLRGRLRAARPSDDADLQLEIARVAETALQKGLAHGRTLPIRRVGGDLPYVIALTPVSAIGSIFGEHRAAVVALVSDPAHEPALSPLRMQRTLGWTRAEAEVAALLLAGRSTREIAGERGVSFETIRAQLKSIYRKSGVSGQAELVRLLMAGAAGLSRRRA